MDRIEISDADLKFAKDMKEKLGTTTGEIILSLKTCGPEKTLHQMETVANVRKIDISQAISDFEEGNHQPMQEN